ncbi:hypothetical protein ILUMI_08622 [Ignelater luminosus]|uniref:THAP-type domain-containing protein n=1 Tax=Ignelater luminosus TaxID=2038154 RepID=A0A8K0GF93_IGNLU|nr:hypothetical protein ILUMI_08622 [Ignelater luminosus]
MAKLETLHNTNCCVYGCHSRKNKNRNIHFHYFPKKNGSFVNVTNNFGVIEKICRRKLWAQVLSMGKSATDNMRVCSLHFKSSDYIAQGIALSESTGPKLKRCAVPSLNLPKLPKEITEKAVKRQIRLKKLNTLQEKVIAVSPQSENYKHHLDKIDLATDKNNTNFSDLTEEEQVAVQGLLNLQNQNKILSDKSIQVTSGDLITSFVSTIQTTNL